MPSKKAKGKRSNTRHLMRKRTSKVTVNKLLQEIPIGTVVDLKIDSSIHAGLIDTRFHGKTGVVIGKQGSAFVVAVSKGNKDVKLIVGPAHLNISRGVKAKAEKEEVKVKEEKEEVKVAA